METTFSAKAQENIEAAELLFEHQLYNASANRAYYAAFHAAIAALVHAGVRFDRTDHGFIQAKFSSELIHRRKIYPRRLRSYLPDLQMVRDDADYKLKSISKRAANRQLNKAMEYLRTLRPEVPDVQREAD